MKTNRKPTVVTIYIRRNTIATHVQYLYYRKKQSLLTWLFLFLFNWKSKIQNNGLNDSKNICWHRGKNYGRREILNHFDFTKHQVSEWKLFVQIRRKFSIIIIILIRSLSTFKRDIRYAHDTFLNCFFFS